MPRVFVGIGSNVDKEANVRAAVNSLQQAFGPLTVSPVYETRPVGFQGENFLNLVVAFESSLEPEAVAEKLRALERQFGRGEGEAGFAPRKLDLDLLMYGDLCRRNGTVRVPREDITERAFVLWPLAEIAGDARHPATGESIADIRARFPVMQGELRLVDFDLNSSG